VIQAWRLVRERHVQDAFTGEGARLYGGRWNSRGAPVVYVGGSLALTALEQFVHLRSVESTILFFYMSVQIPDDVDVAEIELSLLPDDWREEPAPDSTKEVGDRWLMGGATVGLRVPSVIVPVEYNYLLNPRHRDFSRVKIGVPEPFSFDPRMWK